MPALQNAAARNGCATNGERRSRLEAGVTKCAQAGVTAPPTESWGITAAIVLLVPRTEPGRKECGTPLPIDGQNFFRSFGVPRAKLPTMEDA